MTRVRGADGTRWTLRTRAFVWPRWRKGRDDLDLRAIPWDGLDALDLLGLGDALTPLVVVIGAVLVITAAIFFVLPLLVFVVELLVLPFVALLFRGCRVVEARNETTRHRIRIPVRGRAQARERTRELVEILGNSTPSTVSLVVGTVEQPT